VLRLAYSYLITPHTLELHTSGVLASMSRDKRDDAAGHIVTEWLRGAAGRGEHPLPEALVGQVRPVLRVIHIAAVNEWAGAPVVQVPYCTGR
jgi:hypothetical protein